MDHKSDAHIAHYPKGLGIEWTSNRSFRLRGYDFDIPLGLEDFLVSPDTDSERFYIAKSPEIINRYVNLIKLSRPRTILEIGIFRGGSVGFLQLAANAERLLALELSRERLPILDRFVAKENLQSSLRVEYGVDQSDVERVRHLALDYFGGRNIDLIIDDASHVLAPTRKSFEAVFPLLRPGGTYVIEDFASAHICSTQYFHADRSGQKPASEYIPNLLASALEADRKPLHLLEVELMLASINAPKIIRNVTVDRHWLRITRGPADISDARDFDLRTLCADEFSLLESAPSPALQALLDSNSELQTPANMRG